MLKEQNRVQYMVLAAFIFFFSFRVSGPVGYMSESCFVYIRDYNHRTDVFQLFDAWPELSNEGKRANAHKCTVSLCARIVLTEAHQMRHPKTGTS